GLWWLGETRAPRTRERLDACCRAWRIGHPEDVVVPLAKRSSLLDDVTARVLRGDVLHSDAAPHNLAIVKPTLELEHGIREGIEALAAFCSVTGLHLRAELGLEHDKRNAFAGGQA